jgi:hypothetical protein
MRAADLRLRLTAELDNIDPILIGEVRRKQKRPFTGW